MSLELRSKDGVLRPHWYGRLVVGGARVLLNLGVPVTGTPPSSLSLRDRGDIVFEAGRARAQARLESVAAKARHVEAGSLLLPVPTAAELLGVSPARVWGLIHSGALAPVEVPPGTWRVSREDISALRSPRRARRRRGPVEGTP